MQFNLVGLCLNLRGWDVIPEMQVWSLAPYRISPWWNWQSQSSPKRLFRVRVLAGVLDFQVLEVLIWYTSWRHCSSDFARLLTSYWADGTLEEQSNKQAFGSTEIGLSLKLNWLIDAGNSNPAAGLAASPFSPLYPKTLGYSSVWFRAIVW